MANKPICVKCIRGATTSPTRYVCQNEHRSVVHRTCIDLFQLCKIGDCGGKIVAVEREESSGPPSGKARSYYKRIHTLKTKELYQGDSRRPSKVEDKLEEMGLAYMEHNYHYEKMGLLRKDGVTHEQFDKAKRQVEREVNIDWIAEKKKINDWFST